MLSGIKEEGEEGNVRQRQGIEERGGNDGSREGFLY